MKKIIVDKTILLFWGINEFHCYKNNDLLDIKKEYLKIYDNCVIYNYFDLKNKKNLIRDKIYKLKFINQTKINTRNCVIREITNEEKNIFLNKYHIQGNDKSQIFYGGFYLGDIISVMSFNKYNTFSGGLENGQYELSRFTNKSGFIISGMFNKIIKRFINDYSPNKIISFADLNTSNIDNNIYKSNNFGLDKIIKPDFKYYSIKDDKIYHKFSFGTKFNKNTKISDETKTEVKNQLIKVWNCGKLKYELFIGNDNQIIYGFIYMIRNKVNNKVYIGQTTRALRKRIGEHKSAYNTQNHYNPYLLKSFNKYGWDNFIFSIIDTAKNLDELNEKEILYIQQYESNNKNFGYNIDFGGKNSIPSAETLEKMSKSHTGIKQSREWINKRIPKAGSEEAKKYGKIKTDEERAYLSSISPKFWLNKNRDIETKEKISKTKKANGFSLKQKEVLCKIVYKINKNTNEIISIFESTTDAANSENVNQSTISRWCAKDKIINNILWSYNILINHT